MTTVDFGPNRAALYSLEVEEALLCSLLLNPEDTLRETKNILASDLYLHKHRFIWDACKRIVARGNSVDFQTVCDELDALNQLEEIGGKTYIIRLMGVEASSMHGADYAAIIKRDSLRRMLLDTASGIAKLAYAEGRDIHEVLNESLKAVKSVVQNGMSMSETLRPAGEFFNQLYDMLSNPDLSGMMLGTGLTPLDKLLGGGLEPQTSSVIMARPSMGKSAALVQISEIALTGKTVAVFSKEMNGRQWVRRMACRQSKVNWQSFKRGECTEAEKERVFSKVIELSAQSEGYLWVDESSSQTTEQLRAQCEKVQDETGRLDLVIVDHLRLLSDRNRNDNEVKRLGNISWAFKQIAKDLNTRVLFASQISRAVESRDKKVPDLLDLRDSGEIEENVDVAIALHRESYYDPDTDEGNKAEFWIRKDREGVRNDRAQMAFIAAFQSFEPLAREAVNV
jgi:replicative DNA helicase